MPHVVTERCVLCKYTDCVAVCPVVCFHEAPRFLVIDPDECIDCGMCVSECPTEAIYPAERVPAHLAGAIGVNERLAKTLPAIIDCRPPLPDADRWNGASEKSDTMFMPVSAGGHRGDVDGADLSGADSVEAAIDMQDFPGGHGKPVI